MLSSWLGCAPIRLGFGAPWAGATGRPENDAPLLTLEFGVARKVMGASILTSLDLNRAEASHLLELNAGRGVLLAYQDLLPARKEIVIFVHGLHGSVKDFEAIAAKLRLRADRQLYFFLYDDTGRYLDRSALDLARALVVLREEVLANKSPRVRLIGHSMGGIVARAAMNWLADPGWSSSSGPNEAAARGVTGLQASQFAQLSLTAIDTPWHGFEPAPRALRQLVPFEMSAVDMASQSTVLQRVNQVRLPAQFSVHLIDAKNPEHRTDWVRGINELDDAELDQVRSAIVTGSLIEEPTLRNLVSALMASAEFPALWARTRAEASTAGLSPWGLRDLIAQAVRSFEGDHLSVLHNPLLLALLDDDRM